MANESQLPEESTPNFLIKRIDSTTTVPIPIISRDIPQEERLEQIRAILERSVGRLVCRFVPNEPTDRNTYRVEGTGFIFLCPDSSLNILTAQHNVNLNFGVPEGGRRGYRTVERKLFLPDGIAQPIEVMGDASIYFDEGRGQSTPEDIAIITVDSSSRQQIAGRGLELIRPDEIDKSTDDEMAYYAGYPQRGKLQIRGVRAGLSHMPTEALEGFSGGPVFAIADGKIKVITLMTKGRGLVDHPELGARLMNEPPEVFIEVIDDLLKSL